MSLVTLVAVVALLVGVGYAIVVLHRLREMQMEIAGALAELRQSVDAASRQVGAMAIVGTAQAVIPQEQSVSSRRSGAEGDASVGIGSPVAIPASREGNPIPTLASLVRDDSSMQATQGSLLRDDIAGAPTDALLPRDDRHDDKPADVVPEGTPVDVEGGVLVPSRSLQAVGSLALSSGGEPGRLYINRHVQIDEFAYERWSSWIKLSGPPNRYYRTVEPSLVRWNEGAGRGELVQRGAAEAL